MPSKSMLRKKARKARRKENRASVEAAYRLGGAVAAQTTVDTLGHNKVRCPNCKGRGTYNPSGTRFCSICQGRGVIRPGDNAGGSIMGIDYGVGPDSTAVAVAGRGGAGGGSSGAGQSGSAGVVILSWTEDRE